MIWNIIDHRKRRYRWREVNAIIEAIEHDNTCFDADQASDCDPTDVIDYASLEAVSVREAVNWANEQKCPVTLYLYDIGSGFGDEEHFTKAEVRFPEGDEDR